MALPDFDSDLPVRPCDALSIPELRSLTRQLADDPSGRRHLVHHDPAARIFERLIDEPSVEAWLICWMPGHDTGFHDHDLSFGAVAVLEGGVREERLILGRSSTLARHYAAGDLFDFSPRTSTAWCTTARCPPSRCTSTRPRIARPGAYSVSSEGVLRRHPVPGDKRASAPRGRLAT